MIPVSMAFQQLNWEIQVFIAYFTWGYYDIQNKWRMQNPGGGGKQAQFNIGSDDGTMSAFGWNHVHYSIDPEADPNIWYMKFVDSSPDSGTGFPNYQKRWTLQWGNTLGYSSMYF